MKTSVSQKIIIQNFLLKNGEWEVSNLENTYFAPSASFTPKFSQLWHHTQVKHWEDVSWLLSLTKECFWGVFIWMMMIIIILFLLVCSCLRHRNLHYCKTSSLILVYPRGEENPSKLGRECFPGWAHGCDCRCSDDLARGWQIPWSIIPPFGGSSGPAGAPALLQCLVLRVFFSMTGCTDWLLRVFDGSASVPGGWDWNLLHPRPGAAAVAPVQGLLVWHCGNPAKPSLGSLGSVCEPSPGHKHISQGFFPHTSPQFHYSIHSKGQVPAHQSHRSNCFPPY